MDPCILFVDDDPANVVVFEATFEGDFPLLTAHGAEEALVKLRSEEVGVLITDQRMPGMTGVELLERVHEEFPDVVRVLITAYSDLGAAVAAINQGHVHRYMRKPWVPEELKAVLRESLEIFRMSQKVRMLEQRLLETERVYALGVVAAGVAHELRNPITWITDNLSQAQTTVQSLLNVFEKNEPMQPESIRNHLLEVQDELADSMTGVTRVLDVVRGLEMPNRRNEDEATDLGEVLRLTLKILRRELQRCAQVRIGVQTVPKVRGSSSKLGQVVLNLVMNASQAILEKGAKDGLLTVKLHDQNGFVTLEVADTGPGISAEVLPKIFDPFFTTRSGGGTGLGLAISKAIVEELGGKLEAENQPSGGALFRLVMPAVST